MKHKCKCLEYILRSYNVLSLRSLGQSDFIKVFFSIWKFEKISTAKKTEELKNNRLTYFYNQKIEHTTSGIFQRYNVKDDVDSQPKQGTLRYLHPRLT